jgi:hypothetical protein
MKQKYYKNKQLLSSLIKVQHYLILPLFGGEIKKRTKAD